MTNTNPFLSALKQIDNRNLKIGNPRSELVLIFNDTPETRSIYSWSAVTTLELSSAPTQSHPDAQYFHS